MRSLLFLEIWKLLCGGPVQFLGPSRLWALSAKGESRVQYKSGAARHRGRPAKSKLAEATLSHGHKRACFGIVCRYCSTQTFMIPHWQWVWSALERNRILSMHRDWLQSLQKHASLILKGPCILLACTQTPDTLDAPCASNTLKACFSYLYIWVELMERFWEPLL